MVRCALLESLIEVMRNGRPRASSGGHRHFSGQAAAHKVEDLYSRLHIRLRSRTTRVAAHQQEKGQAEIPLDMARSETRAIQ